MGNDTAEGTLAATTHETEEGNLMYEALDLDDDGDFSMPIETPTDLDEDMNPSNQSSATDKESVTIMFKKGKEEEGQHGWFDGCHM